MRDSYNGEHVNMKRWQLIMPGGFLWLWGAAESWWWAFTFHHSNPLHLFCLYNACLKCALTKRIAACCDHLHFRIFIDCKLVFFLFFFLRESFCCRPQQFLPVQIITIFRLLVPTVVIVQRRRRYRRVGISQRRPTGINHLRKAQMGSRVWPFQPERPGFGPQNRLLQV